MKDLTKIPSQCLATIVASVVVMFAAGCASTETHRSTGQTVDDAVILSQVKTALVSNDQTKASQINVDVLRGEVQLNGFVDSEAAKSAASTTAKNVKGVQMVKNNLQIRVDRTAGEVVDDTTIVAGIKAALIDDERTKANQIKVEANDGKVQLGGFVDSAASKSAATELARAVNGVKSVTNNIEVKN